MRMFVDCTQTLRCATMQGIPRFVRSLVRHGRAEARDRGLELVPVQFADGRFLAVATTADDDLPPPLPVLRATRRGARLRARLDRHLRRVCTAWRRCRGLDGGVVFARGDVLLLPDSSWEQPMWAAVDAARAAGTVLGVVQHDFIPHRHPDLVPPRSVEVFRRWMAASLERADFVLTVSEAVAAEARAELVRLGRPVLAARNVTAIPNGADFAPPRAPGAAAAASIRPGLREAMAVVPGGPLLMVGTIEPRKNQSVVIDALDRVLAVVPDTVLLVAGAVGWQGEPILARMRAHSGWGRSIRHFADLSDGELRYAYQGARALVFPSLAEGFGLPIVEALSCGTPVLASDLPVHREVGSNWCEYFDPRSPEALAEQIIAVCRSGLQRRGIPGSASLPTWRDAARRVFDIAFPQAAAAAGARDDQSQGQSRDVSAAVTWPKNGPKNGDVPGSAFTTCPLRHAA
jgi:glycosyltransferase involved in cell wall biosynthesis